MARQFTKKKYKFNPCMKRWLKLNEMKMRATYFFSFRLADIKIW